MSLLHLLVWSLLLHTFLMCWHYGEGKKAPPPLTFSQIIVAGGVYFRLPLHPCIFIFCFMLMQSSNCTEQGLIVCDVWLLQTHLVTLVQCFISCVWKLCFFGVTLGPVGPVGIHCITFHSTREKKNLKYKKSRQKSAFNPSTELKGVTGRNFGGGL